jgi:tetratricopeptide (TPR) repeat protein
MNSARHSVSQYDKLLSGPLSRTSFIFEKDIINTQANSADIATVSSALPPRRKIILRDSVTIGVLVLSTLALFAITSFLFRSFSARRVELGRQLALSGQKALSEGASEQAVRDLRLSLSYAPDEMSNRLLLAEALAQAHHPDQARGYFLGLLDEQPADGFLNLQLARLARQRKDAPAATAYYRAAAVGNWNGDSLSERFHVQLELAQYLIELKDMPSARAELLIAAADVPEDAGVAVMLGQRFEQVNNLPQALRFYEKALKLNPKDAGALNGARRVMDEMGEGSPTEGTPQ